MARVLGEQPHGLTEPLEADIETLLSPNGRAFRVAADTQGRRLRAAGIVAVGLVAAGLLALALTMVGHGHHAPVAADAVTEAEVGLGESKAEPKECAAPKENCTASGCCKAAGTRCYSKGGGWGLCRPSCFPGRDPTDWDSGHWDCKPLGERAPGHYRPPPQPAASAPWVKEKCSGPGHNCNKTGCCTQPGNVCYRKNADWALCRPTCVPGPDPTDVDPKPWSCERLGMRSPGPAVWPKKQGKWVAKRCAAKGEDCSESRCCKDPGMQCFKKDGQHAKCLVGCNAGVHPEDTNNHPWNCTALGGQTPGMPPAIGEVKPAKWVAEKCAQNASVNCHKSQCCKEGGMQCYENSEGWASCLPSCTKWEQWSLPGKLVDDKTKKEWSCRKLGPRTPRAWGKPSLFCFSVFRLTTYEADLMRNQLWRGVGIFGCDLYGVFSSDWGADLGDGPLGALKTIHFDPAPVGTSKDGTAANTALFMNVWEAVRWDGKYRAADWTIKADPDAVVLPDRLRNHLRAHVGHPAFILTCGKAGMADGPMMFGSVEAISVQALYAYFNSESTCRSMPWGAWGEDLWMGNCLKALGVSAEGDFGLVSDGVCLYKNCAGGAAAFHPLKSLGEWMQCYWAAQR